MCIYWLQIRYEIVFIFIYWLQVCVYPPVLLFSVRIRQTLYIFDAENLETATCFGF